MFRTDDVIVRPEHEEDLSAVRTINESAFGRPDEATLVDQLRHEGAVLLSLIAEWETQIVGHILFSRMWIDQAEGPVAAVALAPVAVLPAYQRHGIGGKLITSGLSFLRERGEHIAIVLGHPDYYTRFGFSVEKARTLKSPFPPEAFMAFELRAGALSGISGGVRYPSAFGL